MPPWRLSTVVLTAEHAYTRRFPACRAVLEPIAHGPVRGLELSIQAFQPAIPIRPTALPVIGSRAPLSIDARDHSDCSRCACDTRESRREERDEKRRGNALGNGG